MDMGVITYRRGEEQSRQEENENSKMESDRRRRYAMIRSTSVSDTLMLSTMQLIRGW